MIVVFINARTSLSSSTIISVMVTLIVLMLVMKSAVPKSVVVIGMKTALMIAWLIYIRLIATRPATQITVHVRISTSSVRLVAAYPVPRFVIVIQIVETILMNQLTCVLITTPATTMKT